MQHPVTATFQRLSPAEPPFWRSAAKEKAWESLDESLELRDERVQSQAAISHDWLDGRNEFQIIAGWAEVGKDSYWMEPAMDGAHGLLWIGHPLAPSVIVLLLFLFPRFVSVSAFGGGAAGRDCLSSACLSVCCRHICLRLSFLLTELYYCVQ
jgi:hypothetical protein